MVERFDRVTIHVGNLETATDEYTRLLGISPAYVAVPTADVAWWGLPNTVIELVESGESENARVAGLALDCGELTAQEKSCDNSLGLPLVLTGGQRTRAFRSDFPAAQCLDVSVDHVVLRTDNADACVDLFATDLGVRLALDKTVPEWGGRMLFFRAGKLTLEVIESGADDSLGNYFWGIAYQCPDIDATAAALAARGVALSRIRDGRKPGTRVATVKSHCLGIPTLLIEPGKSA